SAGHRAHLGAHQVPGARGAAGGRGVTRLAVPDRTRALARREHRVARVLGLLALVVAWEAVTRTGWVPALFIPSPVGVLSFGAGRWSVIRKVMLPSALPMIFAGLKLGAGTSLLLLVAAEMIAANSGIGFLILNAQNLMETTKLMVGIVLLSLLGLASHWLLVRR